MNQKSPPVLLIDDNGDITELMACFLVEAGFSAVIATNGRTGVTQAQKILPSIILCDAHMPGMSGFEVIDALRANPVTANIPVVLVSGDARLDVSRATAFLQKPFGMNEMITLVQSCIGQRTSTETNRGARAALETVCK